MLRPIGDDDEVYYRLGAALKLLPGLRLDRLTVLGPSMGEIAYDTLGGLIKQGNGWRELHFITPNSTMLGFAKRELFMADPYWRKPQPSTWNEILLHRDGAASGAFVTVYQANQCDTSGAVLKPYTRHTFEQKIISPGTLETFGVAEDKELLAEGKELLVVANRGRSADIAEQNGPPYEFNDIREWAHGMTWAEIRRQCIDFIIDEDEDEDDDFFPRMVDPVEVDRYNDVDEYEWNPIN
jgi:hypothetical protein